MRFIFVFMLLLGCHEDRTTQHHNCDEIGPGWKYSKKINNIPAQILSDSLNHFRILSSGYPTACACNLPPSFQVNKANVVISGKYITNEYLSTTPMFLITAIRWNQDV